MWDGERKHKLDEEEGRLSDYPMTNTGSYVGKAR